MSIDNDCLKNIYNTILEHENEPINECSLLYWSKNFKLSTIEESVEALLNIGYLSKGQDGYYLLNKKCNNPLVLCDGKENEPKKMNKFGRRPNVKIFEEDDETDIDIHELDDVVHKKMDILGKLMGTSFSVQTPHQRLIDCLWALRNFYEALTKCKLKYPNDKDRKQSIKKRISETYDDILVTAEKYYKDSNKSRELVFLLRQFYDRSEGSPFFGFIENYYKSIKEDKITSNLNKKAIEMVIELFDYNSKKETSVDWSEDGKITIKNETISDNGSICKLIESCNESKMLNKISTIAEEIGLTKLNLNGKYYYTKKLNNNALLYIFRFVYFVLIANDYANKNKNNR